MYMERRNLLLFSRYADLVPGVDLGPAFHQRARRLQMPSVRRTVQWRDFRLNTSYVHTCSHDVDVNRS